MTSRSRLAPAGLIAALVWSACAPADQGGAESRVQASHLFDRIPERFEIAIPELAQSSAGEAVWVLNEVVPRASFRARNHKEGHPSTWHASTRLPARQPERFVAWQEAADPAAGRRLERGERAEPTEGWLSIGARGLELRLAAGMEPPEELSVSYPTKARELDAFLHDELRAEATRGEARELRLGEDTRRVRRVSAPSRLGWKLQVEAGTSLDLAFGLQPFGVLPRQEGVELRSEALQACTFRVLARRPGEKPLTLWERTLAPEQGGEFVEASVDLSPCAGQPLELELVTEPAVTTAGSPYGGPFAFWSEPVLRAPQADAPPNVLVILLDTLRADRLGCYGWSRAHTPNIDGLAARGVRFEEVMSAGPWTLPSHASLFSSTYVSEHGLWSWRQRLAPEYTTVAEVLRARGYVTAAFTEGGYVRAEFGFSQGFDTFQARPRDIRETFAKARAWMSAARAPFFAFVQTYRIHTPFDPAPELRELLVRPYAGSLPASVQTVDHLPGSSSDPFVAEDLPYLSDLYDAEIATADREVGELLAYLEAAGLMQNTLIVLTSDHGEELGEHGHFDHGWSLYEDQLRVPLILHLPGRFEGGKVVPRIVHGVDLAPTLAEVARAEIPGAWSGISLLDELSDPARQRVTPFLTRKEGERAVAIRAGPWKFIDFPAGERAFDPDDGGPKLFDLSSDPNETHNLWPTEDSERWQRAAADFFRLFPLRQVGVDFDGGAAPNTELQEELQGLGYAGDE
jgi:arylsulfatase A-like enzyme